ncbi:MAG: hypothetical protein OEV94_00055 [Deltaproteobacteria bacterium]|nr:hypothetical protein [Deltaproteobacteria bacterium]
MTPTEPKDSQKLVTWLVIVGVLGVVGGWSIFSAMGGRIAVLETPEPVVTPETLAEERLARAWCGTQMQSLSPLWRPGQPFWCLPAKEYQDTLRGMGMRNLMGSATMTLRLKKDMAWHHCRSLGTFPKDPDSDGANLVCSSPDASLDKLINSASCAQTNNRKPCRP